MTPGHDTCHHKSRGLSCADYEELLVRCGNRCEICGVLGSETKRGKLMIDHDHRYGVYAIRGLICCSCNILMRDVDRCRRTDLRAAAYVANSWFMWRLLNPLGRNVIDPRVFGGDDRLPGPVRSDGATGMRKLLNAYPVKEG